MSIPVTAPVTATVGTVHLRLFPYAAWQTAVDDYDSRPWAWGAMVRVRFRIGELVVTKRVTRRHSWWAGGWPRAERPSDAEIAEGRAAVLEALRVQVRRLGFEPPEFDVVEHPEEPNP